MSGGGGGGYTPMPQDNSLAIAQLQADRARADEERRAAEKLKAEAKFVTDRDNAYTAAQGTGRGILTGRGLDVDEFNPVIDRALTDQKLRIPQGDLNPASYFTTDVINNALMQEENQRRIRNTGNVNTQFATGFDRSYIPDTADDSYINELLSGQRSSADTALQFAKSRGKLNDTGWNTAQQALSDQERGARSTLNTLGTSILDKNREGLTRIRDKASTAANAYSLGSPKFSVDPFKSEMDTTLEGYRNSLGGDLSNALGGTDLFDVNKILLAGGRAQGPQNLTTANVPGGLPRKNPQQDRGLGSTGVF